METPLKDTGLPPSPDKTSPILNDLGPVALPRIGKKERCSKPCPRHCQAGHRAGPHQYCSKPFNCGCCMGTCHLCEPAKNLWSPSTRLQSMMAAKRAEQMKQYNQQYKDAAEQAETSKLPGAYWAELSKATIKLGPFGADPFGDGAASEDLPQPESQPGAMGPCRECSACGAEVFAEYRRFCLPCGLRLPLTPSYQCPSPSPSPSPSRSRSPSPSPSRL